MDMQQAIPSPTGISVFGSSLLRVAPDMAVINLAAHALDDAPANAFAQVRAQAAAVSQFLRTADVTDVASSHVTLKQEFRFTGGEHSFMGHLARIGFQILVRDLDKVEAVLTGAVAAGANEVVSLTFQTSELQTHRAEARRRAVHAARAKALVYCEAANVGLGQVMHIEDVNPDRLAGMPYAHAQPEIPVDDDGRVGAFDPGAVSVRAAVFVVYAFAG